MKEHEKAGHRGNGEDQEHGAGHGVPAERVVNDQEPANERQRGKNEKESVLRFHLRLHPLFQSLFGFVFPFSDFVLMDSAESEQLLFVVYHFLAVESGERIVLHEEDGFFRTNLLAKSAEDAAEHIDFKLTRGFFDVADFGRAAGAWRSNANGLGRANEFTKLAGDAFGAAFLVFDQVGSTAVIRWNSPLLFRVLHRNLLAEEMAERDLQPAQKGRHIEFFPKIKF